MYFVLEESSWAWDGREPELYVERIEQLLDRLDVARERGEEFSASRELLAQKPFNDISLADLLWGNSVLNLSRDVRERLTARLGTMPYWDDEGNYPGFDAVVSGVEIFSPSTVFVHARVGRGDTTACLPLPGKWRGPCTVAVGVQTKIIHFVTDEQTHRLFFRDAIAKRSVEEALAPLAPHAFPDTCFVDGIWGTLRDFEGGYIRVRERLLDFLALFDDHAPWIYSDTTGRLSQREAEPSGKTVQTIRNKTIEDRFAALGLDVSPEARVVFETPQSRREREVTILGRILYCEWHYKIEKHTNRVHFHPPVTESGGRPIIAIFHKHLD